MNKAAVVWDVTSLYIALTLRCNANCDHCHYDCSLDREEHIPLDELLLIINDYARKGGPLIRFSGGEPTLEWDTLMACLERCQELNVATSVATNAWWGDTTERAKFVISLFKIHGVKDLFLSSDYYHNKAVPFENVKRVIALAEENDLPATVNWVVEDKARVSPLGPVPLQLNKPSFVGRARRKLRGSMPLKPICRVLDMGKTTQIRDDYCVAVFPSKVFSLDCDVLNPVMSFKLNNLANWTDEFISVLENDPAITLVRQSGFGGLLKLVKQNYPALLKKKYRCRCSVCKELWTAVFPLQRQLPSYVEKIWNGGPM